MPKVSIIMPAYNSGEYIEKTIKSIINQTFKDWELIIVDDCSKDNTVKILNKLKNNKFVIIKNKKNIGAALSRNKALNVAKGRYIAFIDSDDIWEKEKLEKQLNFMKENGIAFSFSSYKKVDEKDKLIKIIEVPDKVDFSFLLKNVVIQISTIILDTEKINKKLIEMPKIKTSEDTAMYLQILDKIDYAYGYSECLVKYAVRKHSLSSNKILNTLRFWKVLKIHNIGFQDRCLNVFKHVKNAILRMIPTEKILRLKEIFRIITIKQIIDVIIFPFVFILSLFIKLFCKNVWLIEENPNEACDNGYIFYKYLRENRKDINVYYVIFKKSKDFEKVNKIGQVILHGSLKHWLFYLNAKKIIVTQKYANPSPAIFYVLHKIGIIKTPRVFLQHGITKDDCKMFYYNKTKFRLFICGAKMEYEYVKDNFGYPKQNVVYTGFARFDNLNTENLERNNLILIAPTWRKWIKTQKEFDLFFNNYLELINNKTLIKYLEINDIKLQIVLHKNMKKFKINKKSLSKNIKINHNEEVDIQNLLNNSNLLITDYSSIFMDIAYRKKPIIYYQFDKNKYRVKQLQEGYFSYEKDGFGDIALEKNFLINKIKYYIENNFNAEEKYLKRMDNFFERKDKNNCLRILKEIEKI